MGDYNKKVVTDALEFYRLYCVDVLCRKESIIASNANSDFAIELGKLYNFLVNTKLTRMSLTKRISYRAFVYTKMNMLYSSAYKKLIMDKAVYEKIASYIQKLCETSIESEFNAHYANTNWKFIPPCIYRMYIKHIIKKVAKRDTLEFEEAMIGW